MKSIIRHVNLFSKMFTKKPLTAGRGHHSPSQLWSHILIRCGLTKRRKNVNLNTNSEIVDAQVTPPAYWGEFIHSQAIMLAASSNSYEPASFEEFRYDINENDLAAFMTVAECSYADDRRHPDDKRNPDGLTEFGENSTSAITRLAAASITPPLIQQNVISNDPEVDDNEPLYPAPKSLWRSPSGRFLPKGKEVPIRSTKYKEKQEKLRLAEINNERERVAKFNVVSVGGVIDEKRISAECSLVIRQSYTPEPASQIMFPATVILNDVTNLERFQDNKTCSAINKHATVPCHGERNSVSTNYITANAIQCDSADLSQIPIDADAVRAELQEVIAIISPRSFAGPESRKERADQANNLERDVTNPFPVSYRRKIINFIRLKLSKFLRLVNGIAKCVCKLKLNTSWWRMP
ncbi:hypothetical protein V1514DRAFT_340083 [Lipomyces japonicus]|uniref:uncharacterized protein n=1 Tax=Lipomyces japonicus TaxID=56871 RepID=UPI0034CE1AAF